MGSGFCYCKKTLCKENTAQQQTNEVYVFEKFESKEEKEDNSKKINIIKAETENISIPIVKEEKNDILKSKKLLGLPQKQNFKKKENNNEIVEPTVKGKIYKSSQNLIHIDEHLKMPMSSENNDESLNFNSINGSEYSHSIVEPSTKFIRKSFKSATGLDKTLLNKQLKNAEKNLPVSTESLIVHQKRDFNLDYQILKKIGKGPLGAVYKAKNIYSKNIVALKSIKKNKKNKEDEINIENQINILKKLHHPNIVKIHGFYSNEKYYQIITEYCKKGELFKYIKKSFTEKQLAIIFYQILSGLAYLHDKKIVHKNIKLKNIMVMEKENDINTNETYLWIKIIDFHTAEIFHNDKKEIHIYNSYYISPEGIHNKYTEKSDVWSVGIILHLALTGKIPFDGKTDDEIYYKIENIAYNDLDPRLLARSPEVRDLLDKLLQKDENKRISAKEALNHKWFEAYGGRALFNNFRPEEIQHYITNLCTYSCESKLSQLVLAFLVHNMPESTATYIILKLFRYFNLSGNCKLTKTELVKGLHNYRNEEQINKIVDELFLLLDGNNNGYIEFEEFYRACEDKNHILTKENIWYAFKFLDDKNTNTIDVQTLMRAFDAKPNKMLEAVFNKTLNKGGFNTKGVITVKEFEEILFKSLNKE